MMKMYNLRDLVAELFMEHREEIFEMELGRIAYDILDKNPDIQIPIQMKKFSSVQRIEVLRCIAEGFDIEPLIRYNFNARQMRELRLFQFHNFDINIICKPSISAPKMTLLRRELLRGVNINLVDINIFDCEQLAQIFICIEQGLDYTQLLDPDLSEMEMIDRRNIMAAEMAAEDRTSNRYRRIHMAIFGDKIR